MKRNSNDVSPRQRQVIELAAEGRTDKEISRRLGISEGTLRTYWDRLRARCEAHSRAEVVAKLLVRPNTPDLKKYMLLKMPLFIWTADRSGWVDFCNEWFQIRGGLAESECIGFGLRNLIRESDLGQLDMAWQRASDSRCVVDAVVDLRVMPESEFRQHKIRLVPIKAKSGEFVKWIGYGREIAENADEQMVRFLQASVGGLVLGA